MKHVLEELMMETPNDLLAKYVTSVLLLLLL